MSTERSEEKITNADGSITTVTTTRKTLPDGSVETSKTQRTQGVPVSDVQKELKAGGIVTNTEVSSVKNADGSTTETTVYTVRDGNTTKKITEKKTF